MYAESPLSVCHKTAASKNSQSDMCLLNQINAATTTTTTAQPLAVREISTCRLFRVIGKNRFQRGAFCRRACYSLRWIYRQHPFRSVSPKQFIDEEEMACASVSYEHWVFAQVITMDEDLMNKCVGLIGKQQQQY